MRAAREERSIVTSKLTTPRVSYYLLGKKIYFILNANARSGNIAGIIRSLSKGFPLYSFNVILSSASKVAIDLTKEILSEDSLFIVMGGDGTINSAIQYLVNTKATFGLIPKGTANDLATYFKIPSSTKKALRILSEGHFTTLDSIKVNANHLLTVGAVGFPAVVADAVNTFKAGNPIWKWIHRNILRSSIYKIFVFYLLLFKRERAVKHQGSLWVDGNLVFEGPFVSVFFGKQEFVGKSFRPCPGVKHEDEFARITVLKYQGIFQTLKDVLKIAKGRPDLCSNLRCFSGQSFVVRTENFLPLLGDGEILDFNDEFHGRRIPRCVRLLVPRGQAQ